jgi:hypothetical protein
MQEWQRVSSTPNAKIVFGADSKPAKTIKPAPGHVDSFTALKAEPENETQIKNKRSGGVFKILRRLGKLKHMLLQFACPCDL